MKRLACFVSVLFIFGVFASAYAKPVKWNFFMIPLKKWWESPTISSELKLTEEEKEALNKLLVDTKSKLIDLKAQIEKADLKLREMFESEKIDENAVIAQFDQLQKAKSEFMKERFLYMLGVRKILGLERFKLLRKLMKKKVMRHKRYMRGHKHLGKHK